MISGIHEIIKVSLCVKHEGITNTCIIKTKLKLCLTTFIIPSNCILSLYIKLETKII